MSGLIRLRRILFERLRPFINNRNISTSKKNSETATITKTAESKVVENKNWVSYGFESKSESADRGALAGVFLSSITLCIVFGGYYLIYLPDYNLRDWAQREAYIELRRREAAGLPLIDPNLIDPAKINLPSDEELGDTEIII